MVQDPFLLQKSICSLTCPFRLTSYPKFNIVKLKKQYVVCNKYLIYYILCFVDYVLILSNDKSVNIVSEMEISVYL